MQKYPVDYSSLKKGDIIPQQIIEDILGTSANSTDFSLKLLKLRDRIENEMFARGNPVTIRINQNNLIILNDHEASLWNFNQMFAGVRKVQKRTYYLEETVNIKNLNVDNKLAHMRRLEVSSAIAQSYNQVIKVIAPDEIKSRQKLPDITFSKKEFRC